MIEKNLEAVQAVVDASCKKAGRPREDVKLVAVSKTKPLSMLVDAYNAGIRDFGENKVQEMLEKMSQMPSDVRWHMIGHLQRNKVKYIIGKTALIHSVDSIRLAEEISREAVKKNITADILVEVNIAEEESKFGTSRDMAYELIKSISGLPGIKVRGLMAIAPFTENPEENRQYFKKLKQLSVDINRESAHNVNMDILSMGMTGDYAVAIEEGSTCVRIGTGIFGERDYQ